ncbi:MAG: hypothetical protein A2X09_15860 [Bacteroidetes bacterium GWF2_43_11]|nr:MAG: hypothetical protein A2X09_15860 [Bacteroidetes bacterium GWF2_43_11]
MIPVTLTLQGIYSYRQRTAIDFRPLVQARLFGIFGRTGSGKSAIIEAITYAIFGETERLNKRDGRAYNMMNLRSNELLIDYEFTAGFPVVSYRCIVKGQRNKKRFDDAKAYEHVAFRREGSEWIPITLGDVQQAVGLNYDNFRRAVIIPQGRFQDFLQLGDTDRTRMMKELFDLNRFELAPRVAQLENITGQQISHLEGKCSNLVKHEDDWFDAQQQLIVEHVKVLADLETEATELNRQLIRLRELAAIDKELSERQHQFALLAGRAEEIISLELRLKQVVLCRSKFQAKAEALRADELKLVGFIPKLKEQQLTTTRLRQQEAITLGVFEKSSAAYNLNGERTARVELLQQQVGQVLLFNQLTETGVRLTKGRDLLGVEEAKFGPLQESIAVALKDLIRIREQTAIFPLLARLVQWHDQRIQLTKNLAALKEERALLTGRLDALSEQQHSTQLTLAASFPDVCSGLPQGEFAEAVSGYLAGEEQTLITSEQHLALQKKLQSLAGTLAEGEACPVCGSLHHPEPLSQGDMSQNEVALAQRRRLLVSQQEMIQQVRREMLVSNEQAEAMKRRNGELTLQIQSLEIEWSNHMADFGGEGLYQPHEEEPVRKAWAETSIRQAEQQKAETEYAALLSRQSTHEATIARYRERIEVLGMQQLELNEQYEKHREVKAFSPEELLRDPEELKQEMVLLKQKIQQAVMQYDKSIAEKQQVQQWLFQAETILKMLESQVAELTIAVGSRSSELDAAALAEGFAGKQAVIELLALPFDEIQISREINAYRETEATLHNRIAELAKSLSDEPYDAVLHNESTASLMLLIEKQKELTLVLDRLYQAVKQAEAQQAELKRLEKELEAARFRAANLASLAKLFKASGFVNFVSSVYLEQLVGIANKRFHVLTNRQLSMELADGNNIVIRDYLNGGHLRSVKTLSGGQTFQASLSLALALADVVHARRPGTDNFFFLDEGFGSLDKESLQMVFDTLRTLRLENRIVGLISHVEELQQEIDAHIRVVSDEEEGSRIVD